MANNANNTNTRWGPAPPRHAQPQTSAFTPATPKKGLGDVEFALSQRPEALFPGGLE